MLYRLTFKVHDSDRHSTRVYTSEYRDVIFEMARAIDSGTACMEVLGNPERSATVSDVNVYKLINGDYVEISRDTWNSREAIHRSDDDVFYLVSWDSMTTTRKHMQRAFKYYDDATMFAKGLELMRRQPDLWQMEDIVGTVVSRTTIVKVAGELVITMPACDWVLSDEAETSYSSKFIKKLDKENAND